MSDDYATGHAIQVDMFGEALMVARKGNETAFNRRIRDITTRYCFGSVWGDETLTRRERSMLVVAILATLGRGNQLRLHTQGALQNGCTEDEVREVLMQVAIYAGIPAGVEGTNIAEQAIKDFVPVR